MCVVALLPDAEVAERAHLVRREVRLALMVAQRDAGRVVRQRPQPAGLVEREAAVVGELRPGATLHRVLVQDGRPVAAQIDRPGPVAGVAVGIWGACPRSVTQSSASPAQTILERCLHVGPIVPRTASDSSRVVSFSRLNCWLVQYGVARYLRVDELARDDEQRVAAGHLEAIEVLGQHGVRAVRARRSCEGSLASSAW